MNSQKGFTLIELIIVIVVLGILAVTAAPQFINLSSDARESNLNRIKNSINSAKDLVFAKAAIEGIETLGLDETIPAAPVYEEVADGGYEVVFGYPAPTAGGIIAALNLDEADWDILYSNYADDINALEDSVIIAVAGLNTDQSEPADQLDVDDVDSCYIEYTGAAAEGEAPTIEVVTTGC